MKLSVVIVNYNVEHFLEQCLYSVRKASKGIDVEVFVVDNNSVDGSLRMLSDKFPEVILIANKGNLGFSKANNQAIKISSGEYVLLLNPDTVVEDDTFSKVIAFMDAHPDAGGLGVKMVDGKGKFLPESKRGLPTPKAAFYKIFGFSRLFPRSKRFSHYHLGYLDKDKIHEIEVLSGAFMLMRRTALDKSGLLDEDFFMYGEDIDLSYRLTLAGYKNYYFPQTRIIHYKGESTKKSSVNYVFVFYNAMIIFARKHFSQKRAKTFTLLINIAIYFRAFIALISRFIKRIALPLADLLLGYAGLFLIQEYWGYMTIYKHGGDYPFELVGIVLPAYMFVWLISVYLSGGYDKPVKLSATYGGIAIGSIVILILYALLPESLRFSRALIFLGTLWFLLITTINRFAAHLLKLEGFRLGRDQKKRFLVIGDEAEARRVESILKSTTIKPDFVGLVLHDSNSNVPVDFIGHIGQAKDILNIYNINEVIFCSKSVPHHLIIDKMTAWHHTQVDYKIAPEDSLSIIGSNSINTRGDLYTVDIKAIDKASNRRYKRLFDIAASLMVIITWPFLLFFLPNKLGILRNALLVLFGKRSWVGYCPLEKESPSRLPGIRKGIVSPADVFSQGVKDPETLRHLNLLYARDYKMLKDANIMLQSLHCIGRKSL
jgi:GT2 family glycosyltransferase